MPKKRQLKPGSIWDGPLLESAFAEAGVKASWIPRLHHWLLRHPESSWHNVPDLPLAARRLLDAGFALSTSRVVQAQVSSDGETTKLLVQLQDGLQVEAVIMRYDTSSASCSAGSSGAALSAGGDSCGNDNGSGSVGCGSNSGDVGGAQQQQQRRQQQQQGGPRATLCVSSQVGCQMGCTFCATGTMGLVADLTAGEIVEQLVHAVRAAAVDAAAAAAVGTAAAAPVPAPSWPDREGVADGEEAAAVNASAAALGSAPCQEAAAAGSLGATGRHIQQHQQLEQRQLQSPTSRQLPIHNVVFMGMGEPLNNWAAVKAAVSLMVDPRVFGLARRRVTVSTVGVIPRVLQLADELPGVSLALSLHAPTQELRQRIVPSARAYKLDRLLDAVRTYQHKTGQRVFVEYVILGPAVNCTPAHAAQLGALLAGLDCVVNLIPWNPILSPSMPFGAPPPGVVAEFQAALRRDWGLPATVRQEKGQDISGACGQLVLEQGGRGSSGAGSCSGGGGRGAHRGSSSSGAGAGCLRDLEDLMPPATA